MSRVIIPLRLWLFLSLVIALLFEVAPLRPEFNTWRPQWLLLVVFFWSFHREIDYGLVTAFLTGILLDIVLGGVLGRYALTFALCVYLLHGLQTRMHYSTVFHQMLVIFLLAFINITVVNGIDVLLLDGSTMGKSPLYSALVTAGIWPVFSGISHRFLQTE